MATNAARHSLFAFLCILALTGPCVVRSAMVLHGYADKDCTKRFSTTHAVTTCLPADTADIAKGVHSGRINCKSGVISEYSDTACSTTIGTGYSFSVGACQPSADAQTYIKVETCDDNSPLERVTTGAWKRTKRLAAPVKYLDILALGQQTALASSSVPVSA